MCFRNPKCNWCGKRNQDCFKITLFCKWYGLHICEFCYDNKIKNIGNKYPQF